MIERHPTCSTGEDDGLGQRIGRRLFLLAFRGGCSRGRSRSSRRGDRSCLVVLGRFRELKVVRRRSRNRAGGVRKSRTSIRSNVRRNRSVVVAVVDDIAKGLGQLRHSKQLLQGIHHGSHCSCWIAHDWRRLSHEWWDSGRCGSCTRRRRLGHWKLPLLLLAKSSG